MLNPSQYNNNNNNINNLKNYVNSPIDLCKEHIQISS